MGWHGVKGRKAARGDPAHGGIPLLRAGVRADHDPADSHGSGPVQGADSTITLRARRRCCRPSATARRRSPMRPRARRWTNAPAAGRRSSTRSLTNTACGGRAMRTSWPAHPRGLSGGQPGHARQAQAPDHEPHAPARGGDRARRRAGRRISHALSGGNGHAGSAAGRELFGRDRGAAALPDVPPDTAKILENLELYRYAVEQILGAPYGSIVLYQMRQMVEVCTAIYERHVRLQRGLSPLDKSMDAH